MKAYVLTFLLGMAICWGILVARQSAKVREYDRLLALAAEQTRVADSLWAASEAQRVALGKRLDTLTRPSPALGHALRDRALAQQEARRALDSARTTADSLAVVQAALRGAEAREQVVLDTLAHRDRTIAEIRRVQLERQVMDSVRVVDLTGERDRWKRLAETAPVHPKGPSRTLVAVVTALVVVVLR